MQKIQTANPAARQVLSITRVVGGSDAARAFQPGDLLLAVDDAVVTRFRDVERAVAGKSQVNATVWRVTGEQTVTVQTAALSGNDVERLISW